MLNICFLKQFVYVGLFPLLLMVLAEVCGRHLAKCYLRRSSFARHYMLC